MPQVLLVKTRRGFPRARIARRRGINGLISAVNPFTSAGLFEAPTDVTSQSPLVPDFFYNVQGKPAPDQTYVLNMQSNAETAIAAGIPVAAVNAAVSAGINPLTLTGGNPNAVQYALKTQGAAAGALQQGQSQPTGSPIADTFQALISSLVGTGASSDSSTFPWGTLAIVAAVGIGGFWIYKKL